MKDLKQNTEEKKEPITYTVELSEIDLQNLQNVLQFSKVSLPTSQSRAVDVLGALTAIEVLQKIIAAASQKKLM